MQWIPGSEAQCIPIKCSGFYAARPNKRFDNQCKEKANEIGVKNYKIVKNRYIAGILGRIANILGLVLDITAEVVIYAVEFLSRLIRSTVNLAASICHKIVNLFTLNCGATV